MKNLFILFAGTTDYEKQLKKFLEDFNHTYLEGTSTWNGLHLKAQVILFFSISDAINTQTFLLEKCGQKSVPILKIKTTSVV